VGAGLVGIGLGTIIHCLVGCQVQLGVDGELD